MQALTATPDGQSFYAGGYAQYWNGVYQPGIVRMSASTGQLDSSFNANYAPNQVACEPVHHHGGNNPFTIYVQPTTGSLAVAIGGTNNILDGLSSTGARYWRDYADGDFQAVTMIGSYIYAGGHFRSHIWDACGNNFVPEHIVRINPSNGCVDTDVDDLHVPARPGRPLLRHLGPDHRRHEPVRRWRVPVHREQRQRDLGLHQVPVVRGLPGPVELVARRTTGCTYCRQTRHGIFPWRVSVSFSGSARPVGETVGMSVSADPPSERPGPLITILIDNYNYAAYLGQAVDSALAQTYPYVEVLVVDDGSTDGSRTLLAGYGDRIRTVLQDNAGQAAAMNRGLAEARGEILLTLDSDDSLAPDTAARVAAVFADDPGCVRIQYRLAVVDPRGQPTGATMPPRRVPLQHGDLRRQVMRVRGFRTAPTSGNAWSVPALRRVPPVPEDVYRQHVDRWWSDLIALLGTSRVLSGTAGTYRAHPVSHSTVERREISYFTDRITRRQVLHAAAAQVVRDAGLGELPDRPEQMQDAALCSWRLAAYKLGMPLDRRELPALVWRGVPRQPAAAGQDLADQARAHRVVRGAGWYAPRGARRANGRPALRPRGLARQDGCSPSRPTRSSST